MYYGFFPECEGEHIGIAGVKVEIFQEVKVLN